MTMQDSLLIQGLELKLDRILILLSDLNSKKDNQQKNSEMLGEWITLKQACAMHGGYKLSTLRARLDLQPKCGQATKIGTNKCWSKEDIQEWLNLKTKDEIANYKKNTWRKFNC